VIDRALVAGFACTALALASSSASARDDKTRRLALIIANNHGDEERIDLRWAHSDARAFSDVLVELGGTSAADVRTLFEPGPDIVRAALAELATRVGALRASGVSTHLIVYYSGHSNEAGLLLGAEMLPYDVLRADVDAVPADVRVVVLDSCASGALVRDKGGTRVPAFLVDDATSVTGTAFLMSSSADEAAQESERIRGSFFTHALVTGLRGAADAEGDGTVSLTEAYRFAFAETLARTERAGAGAQHPAWDMRLSGTGDLVLTDLRDASAHLVIGEDVIGRISIRSDRGVLVAELNKPNGAPLRMSIAPGAYEVLVKATGLKRVGVEVLHGATTIVHARDLASADVEPTTSRGSHGGPAPRERGFDPLLVVGGVGAAAGTLALLGFGGAALYLTAVASDPAGDAGTKGIAVTAGPAILAATLGGAVVGGAGVALTAFALTVHE
jgi:hypothetical protein